MEDKDSIEDKLLWECSAWELFRTSVYMFFNNIYQFLKPRALYRSLNPLAEAEIHQLRSAFIDSAKEHAGQVLGVKPEDCVVREFPIGTVPGFDVDKEEK